MLNNYYEVLVHSLKYNDYVKTTHINNAYMLYLIKIYLIAKGINYE